MRILTRYILREFLVPFAYCLTGFLSIYVLFDLFGSFSRMLNAHISFGDLVLYFCAYLAPYFHYIVGKDYRDYDLSREYYERELTPEELGVFVETVLICENVDD